MGRKEREFRKQYRARQRRARAAVFGAVVLGVLGLAGWFIASGLLRPRPPATANVIDISADMSGFSKNEIDVPVGKPVTIRLTSLDDQFHTDGGGKHQWAVDELKVNIIAQPESWSEATFTPTVLGTYTFYCDICCGGRANPAMNGKFVVEPSA
jgi:cytochrome c oxidase subunit 2